MIERRTPLARSTKPLKRTPLKRGGALSRDTPLRRSSKPIPARSQRREAIAEERRQFVERILRARPRCEACTRVPLKAPRGWEILLPAWSVDVHELVRRSQGSPIVPSQGLADDDVLAVCRHCHDWITTNPAQAVALGLARWGSRVEEDPAGGS